MGMIVSYLVASTGATASTSRFQLQLSWPVNGLEVVVKPNSEGRLQVIPTTSDITIPSTQSFPTILILKNGRLWMKNPRRGVWGEPTWIPVDGQTIIDLYGREVYIPMGTFPSVQAFRPTEGNKDKLAKYKGFHTSTGYYDRTGLWIYTLPTMGRALASFGIGWSTAIIVQQCPPAPR
jgi:hypothetical protein